MLFHNGEEDGVAAESHSLMSCFTVLKTNRSESNLSSIAPQDRAQGLRCFMPEKKAGLQRSHVSVIDHVNPEP